VGITSRYHWEMGKVLVMASQFRCTSKSVECLREEGSIHRRSVERERQKRQGISLGGNQEQLDDEGDHEDGHDSWRD